MNISGFNSKRFLIVAPTRSGGTLLSHALDSHPDIYCHRGEVLHKNDPIMKVSEKNPFTALMTVLNFQGYTHTGLKLTYDQLMHVSIDNIPSFKFDCIIHLWRENAMRKIISEYVRLEDKKNGLETHSRNSRKIQRVHLNPEMIIKEIAAYLNRTKNLSLELRKLAYSKKINNYYELSYETLNRYSYSNCIGRDLSFELCRVLETDSQVILTHSLAKRNPFALSEIVSNFQEFEFYIVKNAPAYLKYLYED